MHPCRKELRPGVSGPCVNVMHLPCLPLMLCLPPRLPETKGLVRLDWQSDSRFSPTFSSPDGGDVIPGLRRAAW